MPRLRMLAAVAASSALLLSSLAAPASAAPVRDTLVKSLTRAVTVSGMLKHLDAFQKIADANGGDRAAGRPGYRASVDYVAARLDKAGYDPVIQEFTFTYFEENSALTLVSPTSREFVEGTDFLRNQFDSGVPEGTATGPLVPVDLVLDPSGPPNTSTSGCEASDFAGFPADAVALVQRGTCGFAVKVLNAQAAGASAVIVMNEGQPGRTGLLGMIGDATGLSIPAVFATYDAGLVLAQTANAVVTVTVDYTSEERKTWNVIAETRRGATDNVVMAGAHLDSVQEGAGINDNGSGSAALLEVAVQMSHMRTLNKVRFAWWGAEEDGLLGSEYYVSQLGEAVDDIALYLNFDMVASPNYIFGVYDGDNSSGTAPDGFIPEGSAAIEDVFEKYFANRGEPYQDTEFSGRSDYGPFIAVGIPAGGLFTGAEDVKTDAEAERYGGVAGAAYDPCYHAFCDNLTGEGQDAALYDQLRDDYRLRGNINLHALDVNADAIATAVLTFGYDTSTVNGVSTRVGGVTSAQRAGDGNPMDAMKNRHRS